MSEPTLRYRGRPVPWVTRWTSEVVDPNTVTFARQRDPDSPGGWRLVFTDEQPADRIQGMLWNRENDSPGVGEPMWADVHSHRQRASQVEGRCQVCGTLMSKPYTWLIPPLLAEASPAGLITEVTPTCSACMELALVHCPHLRANHGRVQAYTVFDYRLTAVFGDTFIGGVHQLASIPLNGSNTAHVMARQMVVELWNYRRRRL